MAKLKFWKISTSINTFIKYLICNENNVKKIFSNEKLHLDTNDQEWKILINDKNQKKVEFSFKRSSYELIRVLYYLQIIVDSDKNKTINTYKNDTLKDYIFTFNVSDNTEKSINKHITNVFVNKFLRNLDLNDFFQNETIDQKNKDFVLTIFLSLLHYKKHNDYLTKKELFEYYYEPKQNDSNFKHFKQYKEFVENYFKDQIISNELITKFENYWAKTNDENKANPNNQTNINKTKNKPDFLRTAKTQQEKDNKKFNFEEYSDSCELVTNWKLPLISNDNSIEVTKLDGTKKLASDNGDAYIFNLVWLIKFLNKNETIKMSIPVFQRNYVWTIDNIEKLLEDINDISNKQNNENHFLGSIISVLVKEESIDNIQIIDGQQRLTTLFLITKAFIIFLYNNREEITKFTNEQIKQLSHLKDIFFNREFIIDRFSRIGGNPDYEALKQILSNDELDNKNNHIFMNLRDIVEWFEEKPKEFKEWANFANALFNNLILNLVILKNVDEFKTFESLNTNAKKLNAIESLKNKFCWYENFKESIFKNKEEFQQKYNDLITKKFLLKKDENIIEVKRFNEFVDSLSALNLCKDEDLKRFEKNDKDDEYYNKSWFFIIEIINKKFTLKNNWKACLKYFSKYIDIYNDLTIKDKFTNNNCNFYLISDYLLILTNKKKKNYIPLLVYLLEKIFTEDVLYDFDNNGNFDKSKLRINIEEYVSVIANFSLRNVLLNTRGQSILNSVIKLIKLIDNDINKNNINSIKNINLSKKFLDVFNSNNQMEIKNIKNFYNKMLDEKVSDIHLAYLIRFETYLTFFLDDTQINKNKDTKVFFYPPSNADNEKADLTIEHMYSQSLKDERFNIVKNNIGNLIPLTKEYNSALNNKEFKDKKQRYKNAPIIQNLWLYKGLNEEQITKLYNEFTKINEKLKSNKIDVNEDVFKEALMSLKLSDKEELQPEQIKKRTQAIALVLSIALFNEDWDVE